MKKKAIAAKEQSELLITRVKRLQFFAETFGGRPNWLIETGAYSVLEVYQSRTRAIWRYLCYAIRSARNGWRFAWAYNRRFWWYRHIEGMAPVPAHERVCEILEEKFFAESKEG